MYQLRQSGRWTGFAVASALTCALLSATTVRAAEWEQHTPYYEDDAWYDVTEWLDGNDYNPTDETLGRWDDENYDSDTLDVDYDTDGRRYGYTDNDADDWFYDYWRPDYNYYPATGPGTYDHAFRYRDYDDDGLYDAYTTYFDWDKDGLFEDVDTYALNSQASTGDGTSTTTKQDDSTTSSKSDAAVDAHRVEVTGTIRAKKEVDVRGVKHLVVRLDDEAGTAVDLGPADKAEAWSVTTGIPISVAGPVSKVGEKRVLVARSVTVNGEARGIDREPRRFQGTIVDGREVTVRGQRHKLVILQSSDGKQRLVDLGPIDRLPDVNLDKNVRLTVRGVPFRYKDRSAVMAVSVEREDSTAMIDRRPQRS